MSATVVIIHGSFGDPNENWFPWLAGELRKLGNEVKVPKLPTPEGQSLDSWKKAFYSQVGNLTPNMVLVGHSLGPGFILNLLEDSKVVIEGIFLVSGFLGDIGNTDFDTINKSFVSRDFNWTKIKQCAGKIYVYNSSNDPYVPLSKGEELAKRLNVPLTVIENGGHLNASAGYKTFPKLLDDIVKFLK
jgi:uncharacterized protein